MKILALVKRYVPIQNSGAEWMLHEMLLFLKDKGHDVKVFMPQEPYEFEGIKVYKESDMVKEVRECDIVISHLDKAGRALNLCEHYKKPFIHIVHNSNLCDIVRTKHRQNKGEQFVYVIYNTNNTKEALHYPNPSIIVHPPINSKRYKTKPGKKITLINLFDLKGGKFFHNIARLMPDYEFLGVEGGYGQQVKDNLPNVEYMKHVSDAKKIYSKTRILLMPSKYESYGRTGIEAFVSGIPVIAAPTLGLKEALGSAGIFCQLDSPLKWIEAIKSLDDLEYYKEVGEKCKQRVKVTEQGIRKELEELDLFINNILKRVA